MVETGNTGFCAVGFQVAFCWGARLFGFGSSRGFRCGFGGLLGNGGFSLGCLLFGLLGGLAGKHFLHGWVLLGDGLLFGANLAFEAVVQIEAFAAACQRFKVARAAAVVGKYAGDQGGVVLGQGGNEVFVDAQG